MTLRGAGVGSVVAISRQMFKDNLMLHRPAPGAAARTCIKWLWGRQTGIITGAVRLGYGKPTRSGAAAGQPIASAACSAGTKSRTRVLLEPGVWGMPDRSEASAQMRIQKMRSPFHASYSAPQNTGFTNDRQLMDVSRRHTPLFSPVRGRAQPHIGGRL
jgi:hypothetical protein